MINRVSFIGARGNTISVLASGSTADRNNTERNNTQRCPVLMLLHGFPLDGRFWDPQLALLAETFHVVAPDLRGFGQSDLSSDDYSLADLADDIEQVRSHLAAQQKIFLCGLSMGGYVALEYWLRHQQHLAGLILTNTKPSSDSQEAQAGRHAMANKAIQEGTWAAVEPMLPKLLSPRTSEPIIASKIEAMMRAVPPASVAAASRAMARRQDFTPMLGEIDIPTLVITGEHDGIAPPEATRDWAAMIHQATCEIVANSGHLTPIEATTEFNDILTAFTCPS